MSKGVKRHIGWIIALGGILIVADGLLYDVFFAGIPYQDPPPALRQKYDFHAGIAEGILDFGVVLVIIGLGIVGLGLLIRLFKSR